VSNRELSLLRIALLSFCCAHRN